MIVNIQIPKNNIQERRYILDVFFTEFLEIEYRLEMSETDSYKIFFGNKSIEIKDDFFNQFPEDLSYLNKKNIPESISFTENQFTTESNIPVIFGDTDIIIAENHIDCGIDIFASSFFMLTRWEEYVITDKDNHNRIPDEQQLSVKFSFNERPIVNEYVEMLCRMFAYLGFEFQNKHKYTLKITHDIDFFSRYDRISKLFKALGGDILKRKSFKRAVKTLQSYFLIKKGKQIDPYDTFDFLMNLSESVGAKSYFYFIPAMIGEEDAQYNITDKAVIKTINKINDRGHKIGIHGAYKSYKNSELFADELTRFPKEIMIEEGRQHFLRFENPSTWQMYEDNEISIDSSMGFMNHVGFRSGTCSEYSVFNILTRKKLNLKEQPLIVMEQALIKQYPDIKLFSKKFIALKDTVKKYKGTFVLLWHNNNFNVSEWEEFGDIYEMIINEM